MVFSIFFGQQYFSLNNVGVILLNASTEAFILVAMTLLLLMGEIDLSLGANMVLGAILCGRLMIFHHFNMWPAIIIVIAASLVTGFINGLIVSRLNVISFIATLATSMIYMGIAIMLAGSGWSNFQSEAFVAMGRTKILGFIQLPIVYALVFICIFAYLAKNSRFFRRLYFIGGNLKAAELSGIKIKSTKTAVFVIAAVLSAMAGVVSAMRFNTAMTSIGTGVELRAVTAAVIGGVCFTGGKGTMIGAAVGALLIACLNNGLTMLKVSPDLQLVVTGIVLILAIMLDSFVSRKNNA